MYSPIIIFNKRLYWSAYSADNPFGANELLPNYGLQINPLGELDFNFSMGIDIEKHATVLDYLKRQMSVTEKHFTTFPRFKGIKGWFSVNQNSTTTHWIVHNSDGTDEDGEPCDKSSYKTVNGALYLTVNRAYASPGMLEADLLKTRVAVDISETQRELFTRLMGAYPLNPTHYLSVNIGDLSDFLGVIRETINKIETDEGRKPTKELSSDELISQYEFYTKMQFRFDTILREFIKTKTTRLLF